jgi:hypothetical protein
MRHYPCGPKVPGWPQRGSIAHRNPSGLMFNMNGRPYHLVLVGLKGTRTTHVNFNAERDNPNPIPIDEVIGSLRSRPRG